MREKLMGILTNMEGHDVWITHNQRTGFNGDEIKDAELLESLDGNAFILEERKTEKEFSIDIRDIKDIDCEMSDDITLFLKNGVNYTLEIIH